MKYIYSDLTINGSVPAAVAESIESDEDGGTHIKSIEIAAHGKAKVNIDFSKYNLEINGKTEFFYTVFYECFNDTQHYVIGGGLIGMIELMQRYGVKFEDYKG